MNEEEAKRIAALTAERNKEYSFVRHLGDLYVNLLRCSRSPDNRYRVQAAESLIAFLDTLALGPETPVMEVVDKASQRVGWQEEPSEEYCRLVLMVAHSGFPVDQPIRRSTVFAGRRSPI